jgi:hypothetical protein
MEVDVEPAYRRISLKLRRHCGTQALFQRSETILFGKPEAA